MKSPTKGLPTITAMAAIVMVSIVELDPQRLRRHRAGFRTSRCPFHCPAPFCNNPLRGGLELFSLRTGRNAGNEIVERKLRTVFHRDDEILLCLWPLWRGTAKASNNESLSLLADFVL